MDVWSYDHFVGEALCLHKTGAFLTRVVVVLGVCSMSIMTCATSSCCVSSKKWHAGRGAGQREMVALLW